jgi:hypothetical protein
MFDILESVNEEGDPEEEEGQHKHAGDQQHQEAEPGEEAGHKFQLRLAVVLKFQQEFVINLPSIFSNGEDLASRAVDQLGPITQQLIGVDQQRGAEAGRAMERQGGRRGAGVALGGRHRTAEEEDGTEWESDGWMDGWELGLHWGRSRGMRREDGRGGKCSV